MTKISRAALFEALNAYTVPGTNATLTTLKAVKGIDVTEGKVTVLLQLMEAYQDRVQVIKDALEALILQQPGVTSADIEIGWEKTAQVEFKNLIPGIKRCVVVGSGKGGVGKSTVTVNLAVAMAQQGLKVGLLDSDIYGPSIPMMLGLKDSPLGTPDGQILPLEKFGIKVMSMGLLIEEDRPVIWRGAMLGVISMCSSSTCRRAPATCSSRSSRTPRWTAPSSSALRRTWPSSTPRRPSACSVR